MSLSASSTDICSFLERKETIFATDPEKKEFTIPCINEFR
jgi:hypothetical protein